MPQLRRAAGLAALAGLRQLWPGRRAAGLAALAGLLLASGQAPLGFWPLALAGASLLLALWAREPAAMRAAGLGLIAGTSHFTAALSWLVSPFLVDIARHGWMAPFAPLLMALGLSLFWALAGALARRLRPGPGGHLAFALALTLAEALRGQVLTGFPWALIGHVWIDTPVAQMAAYVGPDGLTLLTLLAAAGLAGVPAALLTARAGAGGAKLRPVALALSAALLAGAWGLGLWRLAQPDPSAPGLTLRLVQPNAPQEAKWDADRARHWLDVLVRLSSTDAGTPVPDLVIWPETSLPYLLEGSERLPALIAGAGRGAPVIIGHQRSEIDGDRFWNAMTVITPDARLGQSYDKHHLVPFGEYVPGGDLVARLTGLTAFASQVGHGYSPGPGAVLLDLGPLGRVLPLICYEAVFPGDLRAAPGRADWILQITNDAWFGTWSGPFQHFAQARLRAIEMGLPLARVANTGVTAMVDARGRVTAALPFGREGLLDVALPGPLPPTPFARWGNLPFLLLLAGFGLAAFARHLPGLLDRGINKP